MARKQCQKCKLTKIFKRGFRITNNATNAVVARHGFQNQKKDSDDY
jgi:hypothetical protein